MINVPASVEADGRPRGAQSAGPCPHSALLSDQVSAGKRLGSGCLVGGTASWVGAPAPPLLAPGKREGSGEGGAASPRGSVRRHPARRSLTASSPSYTPSPHTGFKGLPVSLSTCPGAIPTPPGRLATPKPTVLRGLEPFKEHRAFAEDRPCVALRPGSCWGIGGSRPCTIRRPLTLPSRHSAGRGPGPRMPQHHTIQGRTGGGTGDSGILFSGCREGVRWVLGGTQSPVAWGVASGSLRSCCEQTRRQGNTRRHRETTLEI